jgi:hypothetical protein
LFYRFSLIVRLYFQQCQLPRRNGPPGVSIGYFQRTIVRYTWFGHDGYRALSCVADSPRSYPASNLPALYLAVRGNAWACVPLLLAGYVDPRFCLRVGRSLRSLSPSASLPLRFAFRRTLLQHPCLRLSFPSVRVDLDFARYTCHNTGHHHLAAGPCPAHNNRLHSDRRYRASFISFRWVKLCIFKQTLGSRRRQVKRGVGKLK